MIVHIRPHDDKSNTRLEIFNEIMIMCSCYHMFLFTEFNPRDEDKYLVGHSYVYFVSLTFFYNVYRMIVKNIDRYKNKRRL